MPVYEREEQREEQKPKNFIKIGRFRIEPRNDYNDPGKKWLVVFDKETQKYLQRKNHASTRSYYIRFKNSDEIWAYLTSDEFKEQEDKRCTSKTK